jgi:hypothetical protein
LMAVVPRLVVRRGARAFGGWMAGVSSEFWYVRTRGAKLETKACGLSVLDKEKADMMSLV